MKSSLNGCDFTECVDAVFRYEDIVRAASSEVLPLFLDTPTGGR